MKVRCLKILMASGIALSLILGVPAVSACAPDTVWAAAVVRGSRGEESRSDSGSGEQGGPGVQVGSAGSYDENYPLKDYLETAGLQYCDAVMAYDKEGQQVKERRPRQDGIYGLYNYFGLTDDLCRALYGESDQIGTGENAADGDALLVLAQVPLHQESIANETYKAQRDAMVLVIRQYLNSYNWREASELERARQAALYIASSCTYDTELYNRFIAGEDTKGDLSFTAYGCLVNHKAVCEGMSVAYQLLARATGLNAFCAPDDNDASHMFVYVQADGNWYKVDLAVRGLKPQAMVNRCFKTVENAGAERMITAYFNKENPYIGHLNYESLAPGKTFDLTYGGRYRNY